MKLINSGLGALKVALLAAILVTALSTSALALNIVIEDQVRTVSSEETAQFAIELTNTQDEFEAVELSAESDVSTSFSSRQLTLGPGETKTTYLFAVPLNKGEGTYMIRLNVNQETRLLALEVVEGRPALELYNGYGKVTAVQDSTQSIRMVARNSGDRELRNIVVKGDFSERLNAKYSPEVFHLDAGEEREVTVVLDVPLDYPKDLYDYKVTIASGDTSASEEVRLEVIGAVPMKNRMSLETLRAWEKLLDEDGDVVGYKVPMRVVNRGLIDLSDVQWEVRGLPEGWEVTGTQAFAIRGAETMDKTLSFNTNGDFRDRVVEVALLKNGREITTEQIEFHGRKVGVRGTGLVLGGAGSVMLGLMVVAALLVIVYLVREKNKAMEESGRATDQSKLKRLVDEALKREEKSEEEE